MSLATSSNSTLTTTGLISGPCQPFYSYGPQGIIPDLEVRKVANGFIVKRWGAEYVFQTPEALSKWIVDLFKEEKKK